VSAEIEQQFQLTPELTAGGGGVFDVVVDGELLFSKRASGRFPQAGEIGALIQQRKQEV